MPPRFVVLGDPVGDRVARFQDALTGRGLPPAQVVSWLAFLRGEEELEPALGEDAVLRLESVGSNAELERELIAQGAAAPESAFGDAARIDADAARALPEDRGRIRYLRQRHLGFRVGLDRVDRALEARPTRVLNAPAAVRVMFDKAACHARLEAAGVNVPRAIPGVTSFDDLRARMSEARLGRVFVKPAHASSASGVIALAVHRDKVAAHTSVELVREGGEVRLYNSLKVRRYGRVEDVACLVDLLAREGVHVEGWVPKFSLEGKACDLRLVVIGGRGRHAVVRTSSSPLTNLHLGNPRGDLELLIARLGEERWRAAQALAEAAAAQFPTALYCGVDVCVAKRSGAAYVLEVNAFGDLLPRVTVDGRDTYGAEIDAVLEAS